MPQIDADPLAPQSTNPASRLNEVTHWWDGSQIYGSDAATARKVRSNPTVRWCRAAPQEHNRICDMLKEKHPEFDDQKIFDTARLINAALIAKTHTVEWSPLLLGGPVHAAGMAANGYGLLSSMLHGVKVASDGKTLTNTGKADVLDKVPNWFRNSSLFGLYGSHMQSDGVPFASSASPAQTLHNYPRLFGAVHLPRLGPQDLAAMDLDSARHENLPDYVTLRKRLNMDEGVTPTWKSLKNNQIPDNAFKTWPAKVSPAEARQ